MYMALADPDFGSLQWQPISPLHRTDGETTLAILAANALNYQGPVDDPFFSAHTQRNGTPIANLYYADAPVSFLACLDQYQVCNSSSPENNACTALSSTDGVSQQIQQDADFTGNNTAKLETIARFTSFGSSMFRTIYASIGGRGAGALNGILKSPSHTSRSNNH
jgi:hypothetical protein